MSMAPVAVAGAGALSAFGPSWRGLGRAVETRGVEPVASRELEATHPGTPAFEVPPIPASQDAGDGRARKAMSRPARLAAVGMREALAGAGWAEGREEIGCFLGVGASSGPIGEMVAMVRESLDERGSISPARLGAEGLAASNPLFTFHVLNNFTLCHGAILEGLSGPNAALFSRGGGTVTALREAMAAIADGDCDRALAGGADTAVHPVTWSELARDGFAARGLVPGEGAALLALARPGACAAPLCFVERATLHPGRCRTLDAVLAAVRAQAGTLGRIDRILIAPWGGPARDALDRLAGEAFPAVPVDDVTRSLGEALAATPALAWAAAVDQLASGDAGRVLVVSAGIDGDVGAVTLSRGPAR
jgi:hypothetical protein